MPKIKSDPPALLVREHMMRTGELDSYSECAFRPLGRCEELNLDLVRVDAKAGVFQPVVARYFLVLGDLTYEVSSG